MTDRRSLQPLGQPCRKAEAWVVVGVPQDDHDPMALVRTGPQSLPHQMQADALTLPVGLDGHGCESQGVQRAGLRDDGQVAEEDVADDLPALLGDE